MQRKLPLALASSLLFSTAAFAQEGRLLLQLYSPGSGGTIGFGSYGHSVCTIGDVDGDGWQDMAVGHPNSQGAQTYGRVQLVSGQSGTPILDCVATQVGTLGLDVAEAGYVDGDLVPDVIALGINGYAVFSGSTGAVLLQQSVPATGAARVDDWDGDSVTDIAYVASGNLYVRSGANGTLTTVAAATEAISIRDGQGSTDRLLVSLAAGTITVHVAGAPPAWSATGYSKIAAAGDLNQDSYEDVLAVSGSNVHVLSGSDGSILLNAPVTGSDALAGGVDLDGDNTVDFVVGDTGGRGFVRAYSGASGALLLAREGQEVGEAFGAAVAMHPGAGAASRTAVVVGVPYQFSGSNEHGALQVLANAGPGEFDGSFRPFGPTCTYQHTYIRPGGSRPTIGQSYGFRFVSNSQVAGFTLLAYGLSNTTWNGIPLPVVIPTGLSCQLLISPDALITHNMSQWASLNIPLNSALSGYTLYVQAWEVLGYPNIQASDAATIVIGN